MQVPESLVSIKHMPPFLSLSSSAQQNESCYDTVEPKRYERQNAAAANSPIPSTDTSIAADAAASCAADLWIFSFCASVYPPTAATTSSITAETTVLHFVSVDGQKERQEGR